MSVIIKPIGRGDYVVEKEGSEERGRGSMRNPECGWFGEQNGHGLYRPIGPSPSLCDDEMETILNFMRTTWPPKKESTKCQ